MTIGDAPPRSEDVRFLTGQGRYGDDIRLEGQVFAEFLTSPEAAGKITLLDCEAAREMPGVLAIYTCADLDADGIGSLPCTYARGVDLRRANGEAIYLPDRPLLVRDRVRFVGDLVAMVVAKTPEQSRDALEVIELEIDADPFVVTPQDAAAPDAPLVWDDCPDNTGFVMALGDAHAVDAVISRAAHVASVTLPFSRIAMCPMELRNAIGAFDAKDGTLTLYSGSQVPHLMRHILASDIFGCAPDLIRVVTPDIGGAFGMRSNLFPEMALVLWAARKLGIPVGWTGTRSAAFLNDDTGRDAIMTAELALNAEGDFLGLRVQSAACLGAYLSTFGPLPATSNLGGLAGVYRTPVIAATVRGVFSNTPPTAPYRGAGRPEAIACIEMAIDQAARQFGFDRVALRRRNMITPDQIPYQTGLTYTYDSGDFPRSMQISLDLADVAGFEARREEARTRGALRGIGIINAIEASAGRADEEVTLSVDLEGRITLTTGSIDQGQGHETTLTQIVRAALPISDAGISFVSGDTAKVPYGVGSFASRTAVMAGSATFKASQALAVKAASVAADLMGTTPDLIVTGDECFRRNDSNHSVTWQEVAQAAGPDGLFEKARGDCPQGPVFPNGCHICEVEIDQDTGQLSVLRYTVTDDVGTILNPQVVEGQIHGGVVQGISQIMGERAFHDPETGQPLTGSFMDYAIPRAADLPFITTAHNPQPTPMNPLGVKGAGEAGTVGGLSAIMAAINDALAPLGTPPVTMPATAEQLWHLIRENGQ